MKTPHNYLLSFVALAAASLLLLQGCATSRPGTIVGDTIVNPTIAFTGYRAHIPPGYAEISTVKTSGMSDSDLLDIEMFKQFDAKAVGGTNLDVVDAFKFYNREKRSFLFFGVLELCMPGVSFSSLPDKARNALLNRFQRGGLPDIRGTWRKVPSHGTGAILLSGDTQIGSTKHGVAVSMVLGNTSEIFFIMGGSAATSDPAMISQDVAAMTSSIRLK